MRIILLGAPGAGKGSQAELIKTEYNIPHISTGDAFRKNIADKTEIGLYAKGFMDRGELVPDEVVVDIVGSRIVEDDCKNGFLLDGFPRTIAQAEALAKLTEIDYVINLEVDFDIVVKRLSGRRMCKCGANYNTKNYKLDYCENCKGELYQRDDDKEETIKNRLEVYSKQTSPLIDYYREKNILYDIDGNNTIEFAFVEIKKVISK